MTHFCSVKKEELKNYATVPNLSPLCNNDLTSNCQGDFCSFLHVTGLFLSRYGPPTLKLDTKKASFSEDLWYKRRPNSSKSVPSESRKDMTKYL